MMRRALALIGGVLVVSLPAVASHETPRRPILYDHYGRGFEGFHPPDLALVESQAARTILPREVAATWWRDAMVVMVQKGPVVFVSREARVLAAPPYVAYVKSAGGETYLFVYFMRELYRDAADPSSYAVAIDESQSKNLADLLAQEILAQMKASADAAAGGDRYDGGGRH
jgi:hypothetical protein